MWSNSVTLLDDPEDKEDLDIMNAGEVSPAVWSIHICDNNKCDQRDSRLLQANVAGGQPRDLVFSDYKVAVNLIHWLRTTQNSIIRTTGSTNSPGRELI
jgi:hypothetical protein